MQGDGSGGVNERQAERGNEPEKALLEMLDEPGEGSGQEGKVGERLLRILPSPGFLP